jgi:hypothetical protein
MSNPGARSESEKNHSGSSALARANMYHAFGFCSETKLGLVSDLEELYRPGSANRRES